ncbi:MAG: RNA polymerase sigma factor [Deltaproteobacteria bacterium]|nr:RNA polymerase sigma factor [Deltaproteobacteria bacterium]
MSEADQRDVQAAEHMRRYQGGERGAFEALVALLGPALHRFFLHGFPDPGLADDLYQETWMKVHAARHTHRPGEPVLPWIYGIARHVSADARRRHARHRRRVEASAAVVHTLGPEGGTARPADAEARTESAQLLSRALAELPPQQREALILLKIEGLSVAEAARAAGVSEGALKVRAHRAYARVRAFVEAAGGGPRGEGTS